MADMEKTVTSVAVGLILTATIGVVAWQLLGNANYSGVDTTVKTVVSTVIGIIAAIAIVRGFLKQ